MADDTQSALPPHLRPKGRGAGLNMTGRFERHQRSPVHDGWDIEEESEVPATEISVERPRSALSFNASPDLGFDRSVNPYRGCEHGCIYCYARPSHAWLGLSPGLDFETRLVARPGIAAVLARELSRPGYRPAPIALGTNTDPYQPAEARFAEMRAILRVMLDFGHPVTITTKGTLIERDIDLLAELAQAELLRVGISITTLDAGLSRRMEPRVPVPARRLKVIERLSAAGVVVQAMVAPVIPVLTDHAMEAILAAAAGAGARAGSYVMLRLPQEVAPLFRDWLARHCPDRAAHVMARVREMHGGADYAAEWGKRMKGEGLHAELFARRFAVALRREGLAYAMPPLTTALFAVPSRGRQLELF